MWTHIEVARSEITIFRERSIVKTLLRMQERSTFTPSGFNDLGIRKLKLKTSFQFRGGEREKLRKIES